MEAHGIEFYHFHNNSNHIRCQGSISSDELADMIEYYRTNHNIISADIFYQKAMDNKLDKNDVCLTFDDALLSQYEVALPVLNAYNLKGFWFVYTSPLEGIYEKLELYHHFRFYKFDNVDDYYLKFFDIVSAFAFDKYGIKLDDELTGFNANEYKKNSPFYTYNDKKYRYIRDEILKKDKYDAVMDFMMKECGYNSYEHVNELWINKKQIALLSKEGHIIGLHSHTHPTTMSKFNFIDQELEYSKCKKIIEGITNKPVYSVSYPCNSFNADTASIMEELGINIGFTANLHDSYGRLFIPRENHSNIIKEMRAL